MSRSGNSTLNEATGAVLVVDGIFGPKTATATVAFQDFFGLPPDGTVDADTRGLMVFLEAQVG